MCKTSNIKISMLGESQCWGNINEISIRYENNIYLKTLANSPNPPTIIKSHNQ